MAYIPALDTVKVVLNQLFGNQALANILYFLHASGWSEATMEALADDIIAWWTTEVAPLVSGSLSLVGVDVTDLSSATAPTISVPVSPAETGQSAGSVKPGNAAAVCSFRTANRGRSGRGRNYVPGLDSNWGTSVTDITSASAANLVAAYEALADVELANSCTHVVASFQTAGAPRVSALLQPIVTYVVDTAIDSQRRRLRLRGE